MTTETTAEQPETEAAPVPAPADEAPAAEAAPRRTEPVTERNPVWAVGRRKSATARVRLFPGAGNLLVNGRPLEQYFLLDRDRREVTAALHLAGARESFDLRVLVSGGGVTGQAGAVSLGIARALAEVQPADEPRMREQGLLTRDARVKERKKYGRRGARRGFQFSKR